MTGTNPLVTRTAGRLFDFLLHSGHFRAQPGLFQQTLVRLARLAKSSALSPARIKSRTNSSSSASNVSNRSGSLTKLSRVRSAPEKSRHCRSRQINTGSVAARRFPESPPVPAGTCQRSFFHFAPNPAAFHPPCGKHSSCPPDSGAGNFRPHHVRLPSGCARTPRRARIQSLHSTIKLENSTLISAFKCFTIAGVMQQIGLDRLLEFCIGQRTLQHFGEYFSKRGMFRAGLLAISRHQADVHRLPHQIQSRYLRVNSTNRRLRKNVIMNIVHAQRDVVQLLISAQYGSSFIRAGWFGEDDAVRVSCIMALRDEFSSLY